MCCRSKVFCTALPPASSLPYCVPSGEIYPLHIHLTFTFTSKLTFNFTSSFQFTILRSLWRDIPFSDSPHFHIQVDFYFHIKLPTLWQDISFSHSHHITFTYCIPCGKIYPSQIHPTFTFTNKLTFTFTLLFTYFFAFREGVFLTGTPHLQYQKEKQLLANGSCCSSASSSKKVSGWLVGLFYFRY